MDEIRLLHFFCNLLRLECVTFQCITIDKDQWTNVINGLIRRFKRKSNKEMKPTSNESLFLDKTVWRRWRWIHFVGLNLLNDIFFDDCPQLFPDDSGSGNGDDGGNQKSFLCKLFTWLFNENGKKCSLEIWLSIGVFIAVVHITFALAMSRSLQFFEIYALKLEEIRPFSGRSFLA